MPGYAKLILLQLINNSIISARVHEPMHSIVPFSWLLVPLRIAYIPDNIEWQIQVSLLNQYPSRMKNTFELNKLLIPREKRITGVITQYNSCVKRIYDLRFVLFREKWNFSWKYRDKIPDSIGTNVRTCFTVFHYCPIEQFFHPRSLW